MALAFQYPFARPSVTATVTVFHEDGRRFLTGKRSKTTSAYPDTDSMPGGFLDARIGYTDIVRSLKDLLKLNAWKMEAVKAVRPGETVEQTAVRELQEETGLVISEDRLVQVWTCSDPELDPRCHVVNVSFYVVVNDHDLEVLEAGDDLQSVDWQNIEMLADYTYKLAFNHAQLARRAFKRWSDDRELELYKQIKTIQYAHLVHNGGDVAERVETARKLNGAN